MCASPNTRYITHIEALVPDTKTWYQKFNQTRNAYNGGDFNGPQLTRLMKPDSFAHLKQLLIDQHDESEHCTKYFDAMIAFIHLKQKTFGKYVSYCCANALSLIVFAFS